MRTLLTGLTAFAFMTGAAFAQEFKFTYATYLPQSFSWIQVDDWVMDQITEKSDGRIVFERQYGGSLLKAEEVLPGLKAGAADFATGAPIYNGDIFPLSAGVIQPFVTEQADAAVAAFKELYETNTAISDEWTNNNMKLLYAMTATENVLWTSTEVVTAADLKGLRIRASGGVAEALAMLGATPVAMGMGDGVQAFKSGAIDGFSASPFDVSTLVGLQDIASYVNDAGRMGIYASVAMAVNLETWNSLPTDLQAIIEDVAKEAPAKFLDVTNASMTDAIAKIEGAENLTISRPTEDENAIWRDAVAQQIWDSWLAETEALGLPAEQAFMEYRALVEKYEATSTYTPGFDRISQ